MNATGRAASYMVFDCLGNRMKQSGLTELEATALQCTLGGERMGYHVFEDAPDNLASKPAPAPVCVPPHAYLGELFA
jgi:hypothetical protein